MRRGRNPVAVLLLALIRAYQAIPKGAEPRCRFSPSCSSYAAEAIRGHGVVRGVWLGGRRLVHCHPWNAGGVDPVPPARRRTGEGAP